LSDDGWSVVGFNHGGHGGGTEFTEGKLEVRAWKCEVRSTKWETKHDVLKDEVESWSLLFVFWVLVPIAPRFRMSSLKHVILRFIK